MQVPQEENAPQPLWSARQRQCFRPPIWAVRPWDSSHGWNNAASAPLFIDPLGDRVNNTPHADVRLALDGDDLRLRAIVDEPDPTRRTDSPFAAGEFWQQDLIEWRLLLSDDGEQLQMGLSSHATVWDDMGLANSGALSVSQLDVDTGWGIEARLNLPAAGLPTPQHSHSLDLYGFLGNMWWDDGRPYISSQTAAEHSFRQIERFGIFRLFPDATQASPVILRNIQMAQPDMREGANDASVNLQSSTNGQISGRLHVTHELGDNSNRNQVLPVTIPPEGETSVPVTFNLPPRAFARIHLSFEDDAGRHTLGSVSLRAQPGAEPLQIDPAELQHPYLLATPEHLADFDAKRERFPQIFGEPESKQNASKPDEDSDTPKHQRVINALQHAYQLWRDERELTGLDHLAEVAGGIGPEFTAEGTESEEGFTNHLSFGMTCAGFGIAYDAMKPHMDADTAAAVTRVAQQALENYVSDAEERAWWVTTNANANAVCNGGAGLLALAMLKEDPIAKEALSHARRWAWRFMNYAQSDDGGNTEGMQYWEYGLSFMMRFATMLEQVTGKDDGLLSHPSIQRLSNMIRVSLCPDGAPHGINDTIPAPVGTELSYLAARRFDDPLALWYGDHAGRWFQAREEAGKHSPGRMFGQWATLYRPQLPEATEAPSLPTAFALHSIEFGILRSAPRYDVRWAAGLKGHRAPHTHHNQQDSGAIFVHLHGERLLIDPGYNLGQPTNHTLPVIDGTEPDQGGDYPAQLTECADHGGYRVMICDSTRAYGDAATRVRRILMMWDGGPLLWLDDIVPTDDGQIRAYYQCGGEPEFEAEEPSWTIEGESSQMRVDLVGGPAPELKKLPEVELDQWGYCFADCELHPLVASYEADPAQPMVTVCQDVTETPSPRPTCINEGTELVVKLADGHYVRFCQHDNGWMVAEAGMSCTR